MKGKLFLDFLQHPRRYFTSGFDTVSIQLAPVLNREDYVFFHIDEITFEEKSPRNEALENVLSSLRVRGTNIVYLVIGNGYHVSFYYGIARDLIRPHELGFSIDEFGETVLKKSLEGNFRGSKITKLRPEESENLLRQVNSMPRYDFLYGVPGITEDKEKFHGIDRLVDTMLGDRYAFLVVARYLSPAQLEDIETDIYSFYDMICPYAKKTTQESKNSSDTFVNTKNEGSNITASHTEQISKSTNYGKGLQESHSVATTYSNDQTRTDSDSSTDNTNAWTETTGSSDVHGETKTFSSTTGTNTTTGEQRSSSREFINKNMQEWMKYIDDVLLPRLDYGKGKGIYISTIAIATPSELTTMKLRNTITALFSSSSGNRVPIISDVTDTDTNKQRMQVVGNLQVPLARFHRPITDEEKYIRSILSQCSGRETMFLGNWYSVAELSILIGLPQKEIAGLPLREEVEFGLNAAESIPDDKKIELGCLVQSGQELPGLEIDLNKDDLTRHIFITGVTGSGKTTTCQRILLKSALPFCVIEPAKTEYRILQQYYDDLLIFTLGQDDAAPFRLNPFEFFPHESISSHVDRIKASIEAAFDMEAAIPQIIETALYECYEDCGWDIADGTNSLYDDPFAPGVYSFPTLSELVKKTTEVVKKQGFDERLRDEYIGSINARLNSLLIGTKGLMLNTYRSIDFRDLLHRHVVLELEGIQSADEKSLIMGFVVSHMLEAIKEEYRSAPGFQHITLIEEAHRLLSRFEPGDSPTRRQGVELFANMLAEIRKYGESLLIVDQIPAKLAPDVLKNTNTKIVHKIFAQDDKDAIGNTMAMTDEQKTFLSLLGVGRAIVFSQGWTKPVQVQVIRETDTSSDCATMDNDALRDRVMHYYHEHWQYGIIPGSDCMGHAPGFSAFMDNLSNGKYYRQLKKLYSGSMREFRVSPGLADAYTHIAASIGWDGLATYINKAFYWPDALAADRYEQLVGLLHHVQSNMFDFTRYDMDLNLLKIKRRV